jgi:DNA-binding response OmpR family regulator
VLVIDAHEDVGELLARTLRSRGYVVAHVAHPPAWKSLDADVILLDPLLPQWEHGLALCRQLREWSRIPILLVTTRCQDDDVREALGAGAVEVICKPFSPNELVGRLAAVLGEHGSPFGQR